MSKMQAILDEAEKNWKAGQATAAFKGLVDAIKLLSRGQEQVMSAVERLKFSTTDTPIK